MKGLNKFITFQVEYLPFKILICQGGETAMAKYSFICEEKWLQNFWHFGIVFELFGEWKWCIVF